MTKLMFQLVSVTFSVTLSANLPLSVSQMLIDLWTVRHLDHVLHPAPYAD